MTTSFTSQNVTSDLVKWEVHKDYCRSVVDVTLSSAIETPKNILGTLVEADGSEHAFESDTSNIAGIVIDDAILETGESTFADLLILEKGPAIINKNLVPTQDSDGEDFPDMSLIYARLEALGFKFIEEPATQETQLT